MTIADLHRSVETVWRLESPRLVAALVRITRDVGMAEDLAQDALEAALAQWPESGVPANPGAWLMAVAKRRAIDTFRRRERQDRAYGELAQGQEDVVQGIESSLDHVEDDVLRLMFICCHPSLSPDAQVTLTLRLLAGLSTKEIARSFLTAGDDWMRPALSEEAVRLGSVLAGLVPADPEVHGLVALMEIQASRAPARVDADGAPVLLLEQDRSRWDQLLVRRGLAALERAETLGGPPGPYVLQAGIAACHARARTPDETDWHRIASLELPDA